MTDLAKLRAARDVLKVQLGKASWLRGIGIGPNSVEVRVQALTPEVRALIPEEVQGIPINVEAVGDLIAFGG